MGRRKETFATILENAQELMSMGAVHRKLAAFLEVNYLDRDSVSASKTITFGNQTVSQSVIRSVAIDLKDGADEMDKSAANILAEEVT